MGSPVDDALDLWEQAADLVATVRQVLAAKDEELQRLREERDAAERRSNHLSDRLTVTTDSKNRAHEAKKSAEAEVQQLRARLIGLRNEIRAGVPVTGWTVGRAPIGEGMILNKIDALLADSPDGGGA